MVVFKNRVVFKIAGYMQREQKHREFRHFSGNQPTRNTWTSGTHMKLACLQLKPAAPEDARVHH